MLWSMGEISQLLEKKFELFLCLISTRHFYTWTTFIFFQSRIESNWENAFFQQQAPAGMDLKLIILLDITFKKKTFSTI